MNNKQLAENSSFEARHETESNESQPTETLSHTWHAVKPFSGSDGKPTTCRGVSNRTTTEKTRNNASNLLPHRNYHAAGYKSSVNPSFTNEVPWFAIVPCTKGFGQKLHEINITLVWISISHEWLLKSSYRNHDRLIQKILSLLNFIVILIIYNNKIMCVCIVINIIW